MTSSATQGIKTELHPVSDLATAKAVYAALFGVPPQTDGSHWHVPDIEAKVAEVTAGAGTMKEPVRDVGGGRLVATVTDPERNVLGLLQDR
ncbi:MAG TPA: glyoxalase [Mycobacteriales bacterium]|nr:glyoxalase [Mycobacteriales bacterium]